jgi:hypothetical protein
MSRVAQEDGFYNLSSLPRAIQVYHGLGRLNSKSVCIFWPNCDSSIDRRSQPLLSSRRRSDEELRLDPSFQTQI